LGRKTSFQEGVMGVYHLNVLHIERLLLEYSNIPNRKHDIEKMIIKERERIENIRDTLRVPVLNGMPKSRDLPDAVYKAVKEIIDNCSAHLEYYNTQMQQLNETEKVVMNGLTKLTETEHKIIELRYFKGYSWKAIFPLIHYQETRCYELRKEALKKLCENINESA